jgi:hypothetical protein
MDWKCGVARIVNSIPQDLMARNRNVSSLPHSLGGIPAMRNYEKRHRGARVCLGPTRRAGIAAGGRNGRAIITVA